VYICCMVFALIFMEVCRCCMGRLFGRGGGCGYRIQSQATGLVPELVDHDPYCMDNELNTCQ